MTAPDALQRGIHGFVARHERRVVLALCALAMVRVFVFSAAFPFFNNVDEQFHFDTVHKYARGYLPREVEPKFDVGSAVAIALYATPEYLTPRDRQSTALAPRPLWTYPTAKVEAWLPAAVKVRASRTNIHANEPPTYYVLAARWYELGRALGIEGGDLLYWIRFFNVPIYGLLIWVAYLLCRRVQTDTPTLRIGVPLILAFLPQDVFFSINSDVLSPLCFAVFLYLSVLAMSAARGPVFHLLAGALVAATFLDKYANFAILVLFGAFLLRAVLDAREPHRPAPPWLGLGLATFAALAPIVAWFAWNTLALGDPTGTSAKIRVLGWTAKPLAQRFDHPIFTPTGFAVFISDLTRTSWRGEFWWRLEMLASPFADPIYVSTSCLFVLASVAGLVAGWRSAAPAWRWIGSLCVGLLVANVVFLAALSIAWDFGKSWYPSPAYPFFASGRLIGGGLVPFLMLYVDGLARILWRLPGRVHPLGVLALLSLVMLVSEVGLTWSVFASPWNWFHLP